MLSFLLEASAASAKTLQILLGASDFPLDCRITTPRSHVRFQGETDRPRPTDRGFITCLGGLYSSLEHPTVNPSWQVRFQEANIHLGSAFGSLAFGSWKNQTEEPNAPNALPRCCVFASWKRTCQLGLTVGCSKLEYKPPSEVKKPWPHLRFRQAHEASAKRKYLWEALLAPWSDCLCSEIKSKLSLQVDLKKSW